MNFVFMFGLHPWHKFVYANVQNRQTKKHYKILTTSDLLDILDKEHSVCIVWLFSITMGALVSWSYNTLTWICTSLS